MTTSLPRTLIRSAGLLTAFTALCAVACGGGAEPPKPVPQTIVAPAAVPLPVSINAVMVAVTDHAAHELWNVARTGNAPKTDTDWAELEDHGIQVATSATLIALGGTGKPDPGWVGMPDFKTWAQKLSDAGMVAARAAHAKDLEGVKKAGDDLLEVCDGCHKEYKGELPSEGIVHPHYREFGGELQKK